MSHIYYDLSYYNDSNKYVPAQLFDNRSTPLITNPNDYYLSVVRFLIPTAYLPIFVWKESPITPGTADNAFYSITMENVGTATVSQQFLTYVPENNLPVSDIAYRFVYSYQQFVDAINVAFAAAFAVVGGAATQPPYMIYNAESGLFSIVALKVYADQAQYKIYFNNQLFSLFENFEARRNVGLSAGRDNQIFIKNNGDNQYSGYAPGFPLGTVDDSFIMTQEYVATFLFNKIRSLLFVSNTVPVANESINIKNTITSSSSNELRRILTDFNLNLESGLSNNSVRSYVQYSPFLYRLIDLQSNQPIYMFDLQIYFQTATLELFPLLIPPGESLNIKVMFRRKDALVGL